MAIAGGRAQPDLAPEPDHGDLIVIAPELRPQLRAEGAVVGAGPERSAQPGRGGDRLKPLPIADALQVGRDQSDAEAIVDRQKPEPEQIECAVQRPDAPVREVADVRGSQSRRSPMPISSASATISRSLWKR